MTDRRPENSREICQKLLRGYQFSESDLESPEKGPLFTTLWQEYDWFCDHLSAIGFSLIRDNDVILLEKEDKGLSNEEKQAVVVLFLLADLWMEKGKAYNDLFHLRIPWSELDWFRDGYGKEYLLQVNIKEADISAIEDLFRRLAKKGIVYYFFEPQMVTLRKPAGRIIDMARYIHLRLKEQTAESNEEG